MADNNKVELNFRKLTYVGLISLLLGSWANLAYARLYNANAFLDCFANQIRGVYDNRFEVGETVTYFERGNGSRTTGKIARIDADGTIVMEKLFYQLPAVEVPWNRVVKRVGELGGFKVGETITYFERGKGSRTTGKIARIDADGTIVMENLIYILPAVEVPLNRAVKQLDELGGFKVGETIAYFERGRGNRATGKIARIDADGTIVMEKLFPQLPAVEVPLNQALKEVGH